MVNTRSSRRTTLGPIPTNRRVTMADPLDDFSTQKPISTSTNNKSSSTRTSRQRMSMIPRMSGSSLQSNSAGSGSITPAKQANSSTSSRRISTRGRKSVGANPNSPYHHPHSSSNSGSGSASSRQSLSSIPPPTVMRTDTRPISDKTYFNKCVKNLHSYLERNQYEHPIRLKDLARPSGKDFHNIMLFLLSRIDKSFYNLHYGIHSKAGSSASTGADKNAPKRKFEDDVAMMFKTLGYPFNISKTALVAAGSPHTWPSLLLAITWLIELLNSMSDEYLYEDDLIYKNLQEDNHYDGNNNHQTEHSIFHGISESGQKPLVDNNTIMDDAVEIEQRDKVAIQIFIERSYESFISGDDDMYERMENQLVEYVEKDHMLIEQAIERITDENGLVVERVMGIEKEFESLPANENRLEDLAKDLESFHDLVNQLNQHKSTLSEKVQERKAELKSKKGELYKMEQRIQELLETIATQEYSIEDVYQLEREKAKLEESLAQTLRKREEQEQITLDGENDLKCEIERLGRFVTPYNESLNQLPMDESIVKIISLHKNMAHKKEQKALLGNVDIKNEIVPALRKMEQEYMEGTTKLRTQMFELKEEQTRSEGEVLDLKERIELITDSVKRAEDIYQREKEEHESALLTRQKEVEALEGKVEALRDPSAVETVMSKYHSQINDLNLLSKKHQEGNLARKQAVLSEFNQALRVCFDYKMYREKELNSLQTYLKSRHQFDVSLSEEEKGLLDK